MDDFRCISYYEFILQRTCHDQSNDRGKQEVEELVSEMGFFYHDGAGGPNSYISTITE